MTISTGLAARWVNQPANALPIGVDGWRTCIARPRIIAMARPSRAQRGDAMTIIAEILVLFENQGFLNFCVCSESRPDRVETTFTVGLYFCTKRGIRAKLEWAMQTSDRSDGYPALPRDLGAAIKIGSPVAPDVDQPPHCANGSRPGSVVECASAVFTVPPNYETFSGMLKMTKVRFLHHLSRGKSKGFRFNRY